MKRARSPRIIAALIAALVLLAVLGVLFAVRRAPNAEMMATAAYPSPTPVAVGLSAVLERPAVSDPPTQVEEGSLIFWGVCMACHGNEGQGLTDEWRATAFGEDKDCWTSKCHASNHPPQGFEFPRLVPALAGGGRLGRFASAQQLYDYIVAMMPWWNPGSLTQAQAWQVTAYILKLNGTLPDGIMLGGTVGSAVPVQRALSVPANDTKLALIFAGLLALAMLGVVLREALSLQPISASPELGREIQPRSPARRPSFVNHLHPPSIPALQARWRHTLGAGGLAIFLSLVLLATGLLEMFYYVPTPEKAALSIETIQSFVPFGALVRNLHYWAAQLLVIVAAVHLLRIIFTAAYAAPRRFNFLLGMFTFVFLLLLDFTGYVLRWDEGIRWALTAGTNLLSSIPVIGLRAYSFVVGAAQIGPATVVRFYAWHIFALSSAAAVIIVWHVFRVRRDGGIAAPPPLPMDGLELTRQPDGTSTRTRITRTELLRREVLAMFIAGILLLLLAIFIPAPLAAPLQGTPTLDTDTRAPWFFLWVQQLLKLGDPFLLGVLLPVVILIVVTLIPYVLPAPSRQELGRWFPASGRLAQFVVSLLAIIIIALTLLALMPTSNA
jgi:quinol-cytochrome oxidoreductase complex cytochrome b subunit/mono/diheme cytochrome c family protein